MGASYSADLELSKGFFLLLFLPSMGQDLGELQLDCLRMMLFLRIRLFHFSDQHETWAVPIGALCIAASEPLSQVDPQTPPTTDPCPSVHTRTCVQTV